MRRDTGRVSGIYTRTPSLGTIPELMRLSRDELLEIDLAAGTVEAEAAYVLGRVLIDTSGNELPDLLGDVDPSERLVLLHAVRALRFFATETGCIDNHLPPLPRHDGWDLASLETCFRRFTAKVQRMYERVRPELERCRDQSHQREDLDLEMAARILDASSVHACDAGRVEALWSSLTGLAVVCAALKTIPTLRPSRIAVDDA